jgi:hypothetical protein
MARVALLAVAVCGAAARSAVHTPVGLHRSTIDRLHGGAAEPSDALLQATFASNALYASTLAEASAEVSMLRKSVGAAEIVPNLGAKAEALFSEAADKFAAGTPAGEADVMALYKAKAEELRAALSTAVEPVFVAQITLIKDAALESFKRSMINEQDSAEALSAASAAFDSAAKASVPPSTSWSAKAERESLVGVMQAIGAQAKKAATASRQAQQQLSTAMQFLQMLQQQMQAMQAQYTGGQGGKWNLGAAYRPPDTNINLSGSYNQGRTNLQISMVPDEGAALLGPNGFTNGVGPANLGLSFNINM